MRIISWNVNGIRSCVKKGFLPWWQRRQADWIGLQEVRATEAQVSKALEARQGWHTHVSCAERLGYSGVALLSTQQADSIQTSLGDTTFDKEGRLQIARYGKLTIANVYFPNGSGKNRDNSRVPYKLEFYRTLYQRLDSEIVQGQRVIVMGDFNTAHREIDLARPKSNQKTSGFLQVEREELSRWFNGHFTDTFRHVHGDTLGQYTWWSQRSGIRQRNVGWRIDYVLASHAALPFVEQAFIHPNDFGSDHCPIGIDVRAAVKT